MDFVAIDFETANYHASSACQLAAVVVRDSQIVLESSWLIRPPRMYFAPGNIRIHGIRPEQVRNSPSMETVWEELQPLIENLPLLAHNARFDIGVLVASLAAFDVACPPLEFSCTRALARAAWPGKARYGLKPLGQSLGIQFKHHDALEDARCCAGIALEIERTISVQTLSELETKLTLSRGKYHNSQISAPRQLSRKRRSTAGSLRSSSDRWGFPLPSQTQHQGSVCPDTIVRSSAEQQPLAGKSIVMLGPLRGMTAEQTTALLEQLGATVLAQITSQADYVVACGTTLTDARSRLDEGQTVKLQPNSTTSRTVRLLSERQFRALLPGGKASIGW